MNLLFIGDIVGSSGRRILEDVLPDLLREEAVDFCVANAENAAAGKGLTQKTALEIKKYGVNVLTLGNHAWSRYELLTTIDQLPFVVRPANGPDSWPGRGYVVSHVNGRAILVLNLLGQIFMNPVNSPFATAQEIITNFREKYPTGISIVDFHAEATSEKIAMGYFLAGQATLVAGTHTHVQTADERILDGHTAYITDVGMTGPHDGVIGMEREASLRRLIDGLPSRYQTADGPSVLNAVLVKVDQKSGLALAVKRLQVD